MAWANVPKMTPTPLHAAPDNLDAPAIVAGLRATFESGRTRPFEWRIAQLDAIANMLVAEEGAIVDALGKDLGKPRLEGWLAEVNDVLAGVRYVRKNLKRWMKPEGVSVPFWLMPGKARIQREPLGVVLVIAPWNYPFSLAINPLVGAFAAGNTVLIKPSEVAGATSALLAKLLPKYLDKDAVQVVQGGVPETTALLAQRFDHILYTGNGNVARIVMQAAARNLTPVTLELGGKSPCYVDESVDLAISAKRIVWGKFSNCGQTCIAPDYILVHENVREAFTAALQQTILQFFGEDPQKCADYGRIINRHHHQRLMRMMAGSGKVLIGGKSDEADRYLAPTLLTDVPLDSPVMDDEIFGPLLPVLGVKNADDAIAFINARPKPLAAYVFAQDNQVFERIAANTSSGALVHNHVVVHYAVHSLPFGGVGESGMGAYHGRHSFETFSHRKAVMRRSTFGDVDFAYPPYDSKKEGWLRRLM
jgi:aldehyde dehydrogenase (NAD+)